MARAGWALAPLALLALEAAASGQATSPCNWVNAAPIPFGRTEPVAIDIDGRIYAFGGFFNNHLLQSKRVDVYDPPANLWTTLNDMPAQITHMGVAVDGTTAWFAGGLEGDTFPGVTVATVRKYEAVGDTWSTGPSLPEPRFGGALVRVERHIHFFGGIMPDRDTGSLSHWMLDLDNPSNGWSPRAPMPQPRTHFAGVALDGKIYALGGSVNHMTAPYDVTAAHVYNPTTNVWSAIADLPIARSHFEPGASVYKGRILLAGGRGPGPDDNSVGDALEYDPAANDWRVAFVLPTNLFAPIGKAIGDEFVLSAGGPSATQPQVLTWRRPLGTPPVRRIDAGSLTSSVQGGSITWCADAGFEHGGTNAVSDPIANTSDDELYQTERSGTGEFQEYFGYSFPAASGYYRVVLHFAELYWGAPGGGPGGVGQRVFDVRLEGGTVLDDYDITADVDVLAAAIKTFELPIGNGNVDLEFHASVNRPTVAAIEVINLSANSITPYCSTAPNSVGPGATARWLGSTSVSLDDLVLTVSGGPPFKVGRFLLADGQTQTPLGDGFLCVAGSTFRLPVLVFDVNGFARTSVDFSSAPASVVTPGTTWNFQCHYRDPFGPGGSGFNFSDALEATFWP